MRLLLTEILIQLFLFHTQPGSKKQGPSAAIHPADAVQFLEIDLTLGDAPETVFEFCQDRDLTINYLINNAGIGHQGRFEETGLDFYENMLQLNVVAVVKLSQLFVPVLKKLPKAHIVNVSSLAGFFPVPYKSVYGATKSFIVSFSQALREELKDTSVKVTCLCPCFVPTSKTV